MRTQSLTILAASLALAATTLAEDHWPQFRGAGAGALSTAPPEGWSPTGGVAWRASVGGVAWSQPVVWGDRVYVTTAATEEQPQPRAGDYSPGVPLGLSALIRGRNPFGTGGAGPPEATYEWKLAALDASTGETQWEQTLHTGRPRTGKHGNNSFASETPAVDGERIVASFGANGVYCYDLDGELLWERDLGAFSTQYGWGTGSSPIIHGDLVYLQCDNDEESFLVALDKTTGEDRWRVDRDEDSNWSTPYVWRNRLRTELVVGGGTALRSYDPQTGELLWETAGSGRCSVTPVGDDERLYFDSADRFTGIYGVVVAVRAGAEGVVAAAKAPDDESPVAWTRTIRGCRIASPTLCDGRLYLLAQQSGVIHCLDAATGEQAFRGRIPRATGFTASPVAFGDRLYCLDQDGATHVLAAGDELNVVDVYRLTEGGEMFWASPAAAGSRLLLRGSQFLYCVQ